jgi:hypothetical protein
MKQQEQHSEDLESRETLNATHKTPHDEVTGVDSTAEYAETHQLGIHSHMVALVPKPSDDPRDPLVKCPGNDNQVILGQY